MMWRAVAGIRQRHASEVTNMANRVEINTTAPDFMLDDFRGQAVRLSDYRSKRHIVLVFNRGFI
jgi:hypothetical protein